MEIWEGKNKKVRMDAESMVKREYMSKVKESRCIGDRIKNINQKTLFLMGDSVWCCAQMWSVWRTLHGFLCWVVGESILIRVIRR